MATTDCNFELENSPERNKIAYALWKLLCIHSESRILFCYQRKSEQRAALIQFLKNDVILSLDFPELNKINGELFVVIGTRADSPEFPFGFFKWWRLDKNRTTFDII